LVSGYAQGEYDEPVQSYRVRAENSHTWVEVYFPAYGWIHFEPTQSIPVAERPSSGTVGIGSGEDIEPVPSGDLFPMDDPTDFESGGGFLDNLGDTAAEQGVSNQVAWWQIALGVLILLMAGAAAFFGYQYNRRIESDVDRSYGRLGDWARWLGAPWRTTQTPYEQADSLVTVIPEGRQPVRNLTRQYVLQRFSPHGADGGSIDPLQEWKQLRPLLIKRRLANFINRSRDK